MEKKHDQSFGFQDVTPEEKTNLVGDVFKRVAGRYDVMNDAMSFGIHRLWKDELMRLVRPRPGMRLLDMAGGTGDIAFRFHKATEEMDPPAQVTVCDINPHMIEVGQDRAVDRGILGRINWMVGDASNLALPDNHVDAYTIGFGLRNVTHIEKALAEAYRVLKPGGTFFCLEFSKVQNPLMNKMFQLYSFSVIPRLGEAVAQDRDAYQYLAESIALFPSQKELAQKIEDAGFSHVAYRNFFSGVVALHSGVKTS